MTCDSLGARTLRVLMCLSICLAFAVVGCEDPNAGTADASKPVNPRNVPYKGNKPILALGGGGPVTDTRSSETSTGENSTSESESPIGISTVSNIEGGLPNGLFPQMQASFRQTGFGGGLVPDYQHPLATETEEVSQFNSAESVGGSEEIEDSSEASPQGYLSEAITEFRNNNEANAFKYLYAHILTDANAATKYPINWYSGLSQPRVALRWGVGVVYNAPKDFEGKPPVIGDPEDVRLPGASSSPANTGRGRGIGAAGGGASSTGTEDSPYANLDTSQNEGILLYYAGDFGDRLLTRLESRRMHEDAYYGQLLKDVGSEYVNASASVSTPAANSNARTGRGAGIGPAGGGGGGGNQGGGGDVVGAGTGSAPPRNANAGSRDGSRLDRVTGNAPAANPDPNKTGTLTPGVMLLGEASQEDLVTRAQEMGLDALLVFNTRVTSGRKPKGSASLKVINVQTGEEIFKSRSLSSETVAKARERSQDEQNDPVALALDEVFSEMLDKSFKASPMPENLKPEHVDARVNQLLKESHPDPLPIAIEIISYQRMDLLNSDLASKAIDQLIGEGAGEALLAGDLNDRQAAIQKFLPTAGGNNNFR